MKTMGIMETLIKVKALADRGFEGEATASAATLERLLARHGMSMADLDAATSTEVEIRYSNKAEFEALSQVVFHVLRVNAFDYAHDRRRHIAWLNCSKAVADELRSALRHYRREFKAERRRLLKDLPVAFTHKHRLYGPPSDKPVEWDEAEAERLAALARALQSKTYIRRDRQLEAAEATR